MAENTTVTTTNETKNVSAEPRENTRERTVSPAVDIYETKDGLTVLADIPGSEKDDISISVEDGVLTIQAVAKKGPEYGEDAYLEFDRVSYYRQFQLGEKIDQDKIRADYKHGVLGVALPFAEKALPRQIKVSTT